MEALLLFEGGVEGWGEGNNNKNKNDNEMAAHSFIIVWWRGNNTNEMVFHFIIIIIWGGNDAGVSPSFLRVPLQFCDYPVSVQATQNNSEKGQNMTA